MRDCELYENELLNKDHFPVMIILNLIRDERFLEILKSVSEGTGFGEEYGACIFPDDLDEFDKTHGEELYGVEFGLHSGEEVIIDYQTFYYYLKILCAKYAVKNPQHKNLIQRLLNDYSKKFLE